MPSSQEIKKDIRESLGLPTLPASLPTVPVEGHICDFPLWSYSKKRSTVTKLHIPYEDGSFMTLMTPLGMPSLSFCGFLDVILFYGQRDLFEQEYVEISVYKILQTLKLDATNGRAYAHFHRDMDRAFAAFIKTDRFLNPKTGQRDYVSYFRILQRMELAKRRQGVSQFYFDDLFLQSLRSGYLKRLDWEFCLHLDKQKEPLARFLYGHLLKRIGEKSLYQRNLFGFLRDIGLSYIEELETKRRNEALKETVFPALDMVCRYEFDGKNLFFIPKN